MTTKRMLGLVVVVAVLSLMASLLWAEENAPLPAPTYVGVKKCKMCHAGQHRTWSESAHSRAFSALIGAEATNPECLKCHTTGFGAGGYDAAADTDARVAFQNVQCEMCHGAGSNHVGAAREQKAATISRQVTICTQCHNPHRSRAKEAAEARAAAAAAAAPAAGN